MSCRAGALAVNIQPGVAVLHVEVLLRLRAMSKIAGKLFDDKPANGLPGQPINFQNTAKRVGHGMADYLSLKSSGQKGIQGVGAQIDQQAELRQIDVG